VRAKKALEKAHLIIRNRDGWELTDRGKREVAGCNKPACYRALPRFGLLQRRNASAARLSSALSHVAPPRKGKNCYNPEWEA
jgi:hypothetical protein